MNENNKDAYIKYQKEIIKISKTNKNENSAQSILNSPHIINCREVEENSE